MKKFRDFSQNHEILAKVTFFFPTHTAIESERELAAITAAGERIVASTELKQEFLRSLGFDLGAKRAEGENSGHNSGVQKKKRA